MLVDPRGYQCSDPSLKRWRLFVTRLVAAEINLRKVFSTAKRTKTYPWPYCLLSTGHLPPNKNHDIKPSFLDAMLGVRLVPLAPKIKVADIPAERLQSGGAFEIFRIGWRDCCWKRIHSFTPWKSLNETRPPKNSYRKTEQHSSKWEIFGCILVVSIVSMFVFCLTSRPSHSFKFASGKYWSLWISKRKLVDRYISWLPRRANLWLTTRDQQNYAKFMILSSSKDPFCWFQYGPIIFEPCQTPARGLCHQFATMNFPHLSRGVGV